MTLPMTSVGFEVVDLAFFKSNRGSAPYLSVHKGGSLSFSPACVKKLGITTEPKKHIHFTTSGGSYWFYIDEIEKNGLAIRLEKKDHPRGFMQCSAFVNHLIVALDLAIADDKKTSVRLDIDFENPAEIDNIKVYRLF